MDLPWRCHLVVAFLSASRGKVLILWVFLFLCFFLKLIEPKPPVARYLTVGFMDHICTVWAEPSNPLDLLSCTEVNRATINVETLL